jgi:hypothetical protein
MQSLRHVIAALPAALLLTGGLGALAAAQFLPADTDRVAVFAPEGAALRAVAEAGGAVLGAADGTIYAVSAEPGFIGRLYASGAWLVLRFDGAAACTPSDLREYDNARS